MKAKYAGMNMVPVVGRLRTCIQMAKQENLNGKVVVDVGCSNGLLAHYLIGEKPKKYIGVDPSSSAIALAQKNVKGPTFVVGTAASVPSADKTADVVLLFDVIEHVPAGTEVDALKECHRVLKKDGVLLLSTPNNHPLTNMLDVVWYAGHRHYKPEKLKELLSRAGFRVESMHVRGGLWFSFYLLWLYSMKWIAGNPMPRSKFLESRDDAQFDKTGIHTIFVKAVK